ncbi:acetyl-CoA carboxylase biotin carboxylase subunit family protein [Ensifer sp. LCM 4579]|uniref:ATP-grasp domain-containing protein n=1 Tax=Ensifer sp. LCM 4579 TaxID=1848292 RepID=UPI0008DA1758|nr:acetyl-CoA carboxylase biotin carboxylase subunit family protein [Ensifer sp. LCM 4579]OHV75306.1 hypothetical protein LCM4579_28150 [Ensifer sp. LCM 4579]
MAKRALILLEGYTSGVGLLYVQAAQQLGLHPIILSADRARCDRLVAEGIGAIHIDTENLDALIGECSRLRAAYDIAGITSTREEIYATVGKLCRHFDLPGPNPESIERCCDKFAQRQLLAEAGVPIPAYRLAASTMDIESAAAEIGLPVVLKPAVGISSIGVRLCCNADDLVKHATYLLGGKHIWRSSPRVLVEEFAQGPHYVAEIMEKEVIGITAAEFGPLPHFVYRELSFPAPLNKEEHKRIADVSLSSLTALGLGWGPTNIELRWTKRGPVVIEVNPRLTGTPDPQMVKLAYGVDLVTEHIKIVIGDESNLRRRHSHAAAARILVADRDGTLDWIGDDRRAAALEGVAEVKLYVESKTPIVRNGDERDSIGHIIAASPSRARTDAILQDAVDTITWSITPFPNAEK